MQHDHHCILSFYGWNWFIQEVDGPLVYLRRPVGFGHCFVEAVVDVSGLDLEEYARMAVEMDRRRKT